MTRDDIVRMAREANVYVAHQKNDSYDFPLIRDERFAELVAAAEREKLAKHFEDHWRDRWTDEEIADAIRARGTHEA